MKIVMISGHFDPPTDAHFEYIKQAMNYGSFLICVVASDRQGEMKKGKPNIPAYTRAEMLSAMLRGLGIRHQTVINYLDKETGLVANALRWWKPDVFFRGNDKTLETMPVEERKACEECFIRIEHAQIPFQRHSSEMK